MANFYPGVDLLVNATVTTVANGLGWPGGQGIFAVCGTFNGATITLQFLGPDATTWITCGTNTIMTANGAGLVYLPPCNVRALVTGGPPSAMYATLSKLTIKV